MYWIEDFILSVQSFFLQNSLQVDFLPSMISLAEGGTCRESLENRCVQIALLLLQSSIETYLLVPHLEQVLRAGFRVVPDALKVDVGEALLEAELADHGGDLGKHAPTVK